MKEVSAAEFKKHSGLYQDMALAETITITKHDRPAFVLLSFDEYERLSGKSRRALNVSQLSAEDLTAISKSKVSKEYAHLDEELDD